MAAVSEPDKFNPFGFGEVTVTRAAYDSAFVNDKQRYAFVNAGSARAGALERAVAPFGDAKLQDQGGVRGGPDRLGRPDPGDLLRPARTRGDRLAVRHRQHSGALGSGAHARARHAAGHRDDPPAGAPHGAPRERGHGPDRGDARDRGGPVPRGAGHYGAEEGLRFAVPVGSLVAFTVVAAPAGVLAAIGPARRAARLDPLAALQYE